ncbi:cytochrome P450 [Pisolithus albus]|nr:cytochrome P450 [Pisolithus albus]
MSNAAQILQEGYAKGAPFKVPTLNRWIVVIGRQCLEDIRKSTDDESSVIEAAHDSAKVDYLIGPEINSPTHLRCANTSNSKDEVHTAFEELLDLNNNGTVNGLSSCVTDIDASDCMETVQEIVCRASNRVFVGLPLCRNHDWIDLNSRFAFDDANILNMFPKFLVPLVSKKLPKTAIGIARAMKHLDPIIKERLRCAGEREDDWSDKPNDILQWLIDEIQESSTRQLTLCLLTINFASIHSTANTFTQALYNLAAYPQYVGCLLEEVDTIIREHGASKVSSHAGVQLPTATVKVTYPVRHSASVQRKAMKALTLSDGTFVPKGTHLRVPTYVVHRDSAVYDNPGVSNPFRFSQLSDDEDASARYQMVGVTQDYFPFGFGKHAWYGCAHL